MKRISTTIFVLALGAWTANGALDASTLSIISPTESIEVQQHPHRRERPPRREPIMNESDFHFLFNIIKGKAFDKDRLELLSVGVLDNYFSCRQCAKLLSICTFDDEKLKMLDILAGHIVDLKNVYLILDSLTFDGNREKAARRLLGHR